jgi:subtilisin-like proprotein convertase family protein
MQKLRCAAVLFIIIYSVSKESLNAQIAYSPLIDSIIYLADQSTVGMSDRQLSGDTSVAVGSTPQWITTRNFQFNSVQNLAAQFIKEKFEVYGLEARYQDYSATGRNVLGWKIGTRFPEKKFIICAHYDDMPTALVAPGADDNASGVVAVLEAARILAGFPTEYTLEFAVWDEEEIGLLGSEAYADSASSEGMQIMGVLNFDMIAWDSNNDFKMTIGTNSNSFNLTSDYEAAMGLYTPEINWNYTDIEASDHASFWNAGYPALLGIEEYPGDFNAYYHTPEDNFSNINLPYFTRMVQAAIAGLASLGWNCKMHLQHQAISSGADTSDQTATLSINTPKTVATGSNHPRLYYKVNEGNFQFLAPNTISGTKYSFQIPGQDFGSTISYYFAVQDSEGIIIETLPDGGKGINPPGTVSPTGFFTYFVAPDQLQTVCSESQAKVIPDMAVLYDTIQVPFEGGVKDIDVTVNISHTRVKTLNVSLIGPDGATIVLSSGNGGVGANFTNTIFDDEAPVSITAGTAPFTGRFKPEQPLSSFDTKSVNGNWVLKIQDSVISQSGTLNDWCLNMDYYDLTAAIEDKIEPRSPELGQNFPNPAISTTTFPFRLTSADNIELVLHDIFGRKVRTLAEGYFEEGMHWITGDLSGLPAGTYYYRLHTRSKSLSRILLIIN